MPTRSPDQELEFENVAIGGPPPLRIQYTEVPTDDIRLDRDNPRLRYKLALHPDKTLSSFLFENEDTKHLKADIEANGLFERPYLRRDPDGKFTVIEGNRRVSCYHVLHAADPANERWQTMPVRILPPNTSDKQQAMLMAQFHVAGKVKWDAHEKAGHVYYMAEKLMVPMDTLKTILHMGEPAITALTKAYKMLMERYAVVHDGRYRQDAEGKWSFFAEVYKQKGLRDRIDADPFFADEFCTWVGDGRIPRAEDVRKLPAILSDNDANRIFKLEPSAVAFNKAKSIADDRNPASRSRFFKAVGEMIAAGRKADLDDIQMAANNEKAKSQLVEARNVLDRLNTQAVAARI